MAHDVEIAEFYVDAAVGLEHLFQTVQILPFALNVVDDLCRRQVAGFLLRRVYHGAYHNKGVSLNSCSRKSMSLVVYEVRRCST